MLESAKRAFWCEHLKEWEKSKSTQSAYCRKHELSIKSFGYWKRQLSDQLKQVKGQLRLVPVPNKEVMTEAKEAAILIQCGDFRIEVTRGFHTGTLRQVLATVRGL